MSSYFASGPAKISKEVLQMLIDGINEFTQIIDSIDNSNCLHPLSLSILETHHRTNTMSHLVDHTKSMLYDLLNIPHEFDILFISGGASYAFAQIPMNLCNQNIQYIISGKWSSNAHLEYCRYKNMISDLSQHQCVENNPAVDLTKTKYDLSAWQKEFIDSMHSFTCIENNGIKNTEQYNQYIDQQYYSFFAQYSQQCNDIDYIHYTSNETIDGTNIGRILFNDALNHHQNLFYQNKHSTQKLLICDASSDILTNNINWNLHGIVYAGCSKNLGIAGMHIVIIRKSILDDIGLYANHDQAHDKNLSKIPNIFNYYQIAMNNSLYNTPSIFQIFTLSKVLEWSIKQGGLEHMREMTNKKAKMIYDVIDDNKDIYINQIYPLFRSKTNLVFNFIKEQFLQQFLQQAAMHGLYGLAGHKTANNARISLYNAIEVADVAKLANFMRKFIITLDGI